MFCPLVLLLLDKVDGVAEDATLDEPLDERPGCEASISARLHQEAVAEEVIERIIDAETKRCAPPFKEEAQIDQKVVVEQVPEDENHADACKDDAHSVVALDDRLLRDQVNEVEGATEEQAGPSNQECQFRILDDVK